MESHAPKGPISCTAMTGEAARLGWIAGASAVTRSAVLQAALGIPEIWIARDDQLPTTAPGLAGGTKLRKLDVLLAAEPWASADAWAGVGAEGSGQLVALITAAKQLGRDVHAYTFPTAGDVAENRAFIDAHARVEHRSRSCVEHRSRSRVSLALRHPTLFTARTFRGAAVIPPGATSPLSTLGVVAGAQALAEAIHRGDFPSPARVYVPLGSGGTAAGIAIGLAIGGIAAQVHAVRVVEAPLMSARRLRALIRATCRLLKSQGVAVPPVPPVLVRGGQLGRGYGVPTQASKAAAEALQAAGVTADGVYLGKAAACMASDAHSLCEAGRPVLLWATGSAPP